MPCATSYLKTATIGTLSKGKSDDDDKLIYKPPPLDEFWLLEPESRDQCAVLEDQRRRQESYEHQLASDTSKDTQNFPDDCLPGLVMLDDEESDDESIANYPSSARD